MTHLPETKISAAICTYNRYELLEKTIASLRAQDIDANGYKIIVVDNSPTNETARTFKQRYDSHSNIHYFIEERPGVSNARNIAARICNSEYIAYIDDDAVADVSWLKSILNAFNSFGSRAGVVCGKVNPIWPVDPPSWLPQSVLSALTIVEGADSMQIAEPGQSFAGTNFSVRVAPLRALGGFSLSLGRVGSSSILLSNEEREIIERMRNAGYEAIWAPAAKVDHLVHCERITQSWLRKRYAWQAVSDFIAKPDAALNNLDGSWDVVSDYLRYVSPQLQSPSALFEPSVDSQVVERQMYSIYCLTLLLLAGEEPRKRPSAPCSGEGILSRLRSFLISLRRIVSSVLTSVKQEI